MSGKNAPTPEQRRRQVMAAVSALTLSLGLAVPGDASALVPGVGKFVKTRDAASGMASREASWKLTLVAAASLFRATAKASPLASTHLR